MSTPPTSEDDAPRILVALPPGPLRERVLRLLAERAVEVTAALPPEELAETVDGTQADVVIMRHDDLAPSDAESLDRIAEDTDAADVVVIGADLDAARRVDLVSAGAAEVIDVANLDASTAHGIELLATGDGGHAAPESPSGPRPALSDFASHSKSMLSLLDLVQRVGPSDSTLLITGETGVGKEHLARALHAEGPRSEGPFVAVNCGALAAELLESELFGHVEGAFTGAQQARPGAFVSADGGTLLLDEVGEMSSAMQVKLLRVLQRGEVRPVGADKDTAVDVRVLAATHRDLRTEVAEGRFREDLFFRLNVVELPIPPLRERREDLATIVGSLLRHFRGRRPTDKAPRFSEAALDAMLAYAWPGNMRELTNAVERALLVCRDGVVRPGDLPVEVREHAGHAMAGASPAGLGPEVLALPWKEARQAIVNAAERTYLDALLTETAGVVGDAAERAGLSPRSLYGKMKRHGLRKEDYRGG